MTDARHDPTPDPSTDPKPGTPRPEHPHRRATGTGSWLLDRKSSFRTALALTVLGFALLGLAGPGWWGDGLSFVALGFALLWALFEAIWLLIDRATPDPIAEPPEE